MPFRGSEMLAPSAAAKGECKTAVPMETLMLCKAVEEQNGATLSSCLCMGSINFRAVAGMGRCHQEAINLQNW